MRIALLACDPEIEFGDDRACPARLRGVARALARAGHEVTVLAPGHPPAEGDADGVAVRQLRAPVTAREVDWHFSHVQPEIVIERLVPGSLEGAVAAGEAGIPHVWDIEAESRADMLSLSPSIRGGLPDALHRSGAAIVDSESTLARVHDVAGEDYPAAVVPDGAERELLEGPPHDEIERIAARLHLDDGRPCVGFHGSLGRESGVLAAIAAAATFEASARPRVVAIGDGPERNPALALAHRLGVPLVLCGRVAARELPAHLAVCDTVVISSDCGDGTSRALLEAMATGRAVVAFEGDSTPRATRNGHDVRLVPRDNVEALAATLRELASEPARRARLGSNARRTVRERHTWDSRAGSIVEFLGSLADRAPFQRPTWRDGSMPGAISG